MGSELVLLCRVCPTWLRGEVDWQTPYDSLGLMLGGWYCSEGDLRWPFQNSVIYRGHVHNHELDHLGGNLWPGPDGEG